MAEKGLELVAEAQLARVFEVSIFDIYRRLKCNFSSRETCEANNRLRLTGCNFYGNLREPIPLLSCEFRPSPPLSNRVAHTIDYCLANLRNKSSRYR